MQDCLRIQVSSFQRIRLSRREAHGQSLSTGESETTAAKAQGYADGVGDSVMGKAKVCLRSSHDSCASPVSQYPPRIIADIVAARCALYDARCFVSIWPCVEVLQLL